MERITELTRKAYRGLEDKKYVSDFFSKRPKQRSHGFVFTSTRNKAVAGEKLESDKFRLVRLDGDYSTPSVKDMAYATDPPRNPRGKTLDSAKFYVEILEFPEIPETRKNQVIDRLRRLNRRPDGRIHSVNECSKIEKFL